MPLGTEVGLGTGETVLDRDPAALFNKCSAVAEIGDRLVATDMGRKLGAVPLFWGELGCHLTQCGVGQDLPPYQVAP